MGDDNCHPYFLMKKILVLSFIILSSSSNTLAQKYFFYVAAESDDIVELIEFDAQKKEAHIVESIEVGTFPAENEGPHGMTVSQDGKHWFVTIAHGMPYGQVWKFETSTNKVVGKTELGLFPASMEISEITGFLYIVNFNLHGEMEASTVSVVDPETMDLIENIPVGIMPHGSRISSDGNYQYHVSMMTDELFEIDTQRLEVSRRLKLTEKDMTMNHEGHDMKNNEGMMMHNTIVKPTWADPHPSQNMVYVAGNGSHEILEINTDDWKVTRRFNAGSGNAPYNLEVSSDGKLLVASYKGGAATGIWDLDEGKELAKISNSRKVSHGVSISPDSRYAFISIEGIGGEPGSVDVIDLRSFEMIDTIETGKQAGGIYFWKVES